MDLQKCSIPGCEKQPKHVCQCQEPNPLICESHFNWHLEDSRVKNHTIQPFFAKLPDDEISILKKAKNMLLRVRTDSISQITEQYLDKLTELRQEYSTKLGKIREDIDPLLDRLEIAIASEDTLISSTDDDLILKLRQYADLPEDKQENPLKRLLLRQVGTLPCNPKFTIPERFVIGSKKVRKP